MHASSVSAWFLHWFDSLISPGVKYIFDKRGKKTFNLLKQGPMSCQGAISWSTGVLHPLDPMRTTAMVNVANGGSWRWHMIGHIYAHGGRALVNRVLLAPFSNSASSGQSGVCNSLNEQGNSHCGQHSVRPVRTPGPLKFTKHIAAMGLRYNYE